MPDDQMIEEDFSPPEVDDLTHYMQATTDRCGKKITFAKGETAPGDWASVEKPRANLHALLCPTCLSEFPAWFRDA